MLEQVGAVSAFGAAAEATPLSDGGKAHLDSVIAAFLRFARGVPIVVEGYAADVDVAAQ